MNHSIAENEPESVEAVHQHMQTRLPTTRSNVRSEHSRGGGGGTELEDTNGREIRDVSNRNGNSTQRSDGDRGDRRSNDTWTRALGFAIFGVAGMATLAVATYHAGQAIAAEVARRKVDEVLQKYMRDGDLYVDPLSLVAMDASCRELRLVTRPLKVDIKRFRSMARSFGVEDVVVRYVNALAGDGAFVDKAIAEHWWCELELEHGLGFIVCVKHMFKDGATMRLLYARDRQEAHSLGFASSSVEMDDAPELEPSQECLGHRQLVEVPVDIAGPRVVEIIGLLQTISPRYDVLRSNCQHLCRAVYDWFMDHLAVAFLDKETGRTRPVGMSKAAAHDIRLEIDRAPRRVREGHSLDRDHSPPSTIAPEAAQSTASVEEDFLEDLISSLSLEHGTGRSAS